MSILVSIIIPIYNSEKYLERCINSVLCQTYTNWELLLIDDGSTDCSNSICRTYVQNDPRVRLYTQENRGASSARNLGLSNANGNWITFIDSDDYVNTEYIASFIESLRSSTSLFYYQGLIDEDLDGNIVFRNANEIIGYNASKFYHLATIKKYSITYLNNIEHGEDLAFIVDYASHIDQIQPLPVMHYHYCRRSDSISQTKPIDILIQNLTLFRHSLAKTRFLPIVNYIKKNIYCDLLNILHEWYKISNPFQRKKLFEMIFVTDGMYGYFPKQFKIDTFIVYLIKKKFFTIAGFTLYFHRKFISLLSI